jgi:biopolymer transport protein ExbD
MSHGGSEDSGEPNLTPLLDMVLQLVMFFMMVANFTMEEVNADIKLPVALSAHAMDKSDMEDVLYLNINQDGHMVVGGRPKPLVTAADIDDFLNEKKREFIDKAKAKGDTSGKLNALIIIRGHKYADYKDVYKVMQQCKKNGFNRWQVRAMTKAGA